MLSQVWVGKDANFDSYEQLRTAVKPHFDSAAEAIAHMKGELKAHSKATAKLSTMHAIEFARIRLECLVTSIKETSQFIANTAIWLKRLETNAAQNPETKESIQDEQKNLQDKKNELTKKCQDLRLALAATYAYGSKENKIACNYYFALQFITNEKRIGNTQWFYTILSYMNFSRLTVFKLLDSINQSLIATDEIIKEIHSKHPSIVPSELAFFLNGMSVLGAALYGARILGDAAFIVNAAWNSGPNLSWKEAMWIALFKDNRHHRMFNNTVWFAIMVVRLTCVEMMKNVSSYVFCVGYLIDLYQNLWKASAQINELESLKMKLADPNSCEAKALDQKITDTKAELWEDTRLYFIAYLGTVLGAAGFAAKTLVGIGALGSALIPFAIVAVGIALAYFPLRRTYGKEFLSDAKNINRVYVAMAFALLVGITLSAVLFFNPASLAAVTLAVCVGASVLGLIYTGGAQFLFTKNGDRWGRLKETNGLFSAILIPFIALGAMTAIAFVPALLWPITIAAVVSCFIVLVGQYLMNKSEKPIASDKAKSLENIPLEKQFIKGMRPLKAGLFKAETKRNASPASISSSDSERSFDADSPTTTENGSPMSSPASSEESAVRLSV